MTSDNGTEKAERPTGDPYAKPDSPSAYIGSQPERVAETIPGGIGGDDERIAAHSTQVEPTDVEPTDDDTNAPPDRREAGQSR